MTLKISTYTKILPKIKDEKNFTRLSLYSCNNIILINSINVRVSGFKTLKSNLSFFHILRPQTSARNSCSRKIFTSNKTIRGEKRSHSKRKRVIPEPVDLFLSRYRSGLRFLQTRALSFFLARTAGVLLTRRRMAINHGNWLAVYGRRREGIGFTRDCITGWGVSQLPGVAFYNVTTDISHPSLPPCSIPRVYPRPQQARAAHARFKTAISAIINAAILTECLHGISIRETDDCRRPIIITLNRNLFTNC